MAQIATTNRSKKIAYAQPPGPEERAIDPHRYSKEYLLRVIMKQEQTL